MKHNHIFLILNLKKIKIDFFFNYLIMKSVSNKLSNILLTKPIPRDEWNASVSNCCCVSHNRKRKCVCWV